MKIGFVDKPPKDVYLAFSGGIDSAVLLHNLYRRKYKITLLTVDHGERYSCVEVDFCKRMSKYYGIPYIIEKIPLYDKSTSKESFWSTHRNDIFQKKDKIVLTGHHLNDAVEWYLMSTFQGTPKLINIRNKNVSRPLLGTTKADIEKYAQCFNLLYLTDPTNSDLSFNLRNKVRHDLVDNVKKHFPGIEKTVKRLILSKQARLEKDEKD